MTMINKWINHLSLRAEIFVSEATHPVYVNPAFCACPTCLLVHLGHNI